MTKQILFLVEASNRSGMGHFWRSISVAEELTQMGLIVKYHSEYLSGTAIAILDSLDIQNVSAVENAKEFSAAVFDGYSFQQGDLDSFSSLPVVLFEDFCHRAISANLVIDANISNSSLSEYSLVECDQLLEGPSYVCLRKSLASLKMNSTKPSARPYSYLISLGGADPKGVTPKVLRAMLSVGKDNAQIGVVLGPLFLPHATPEDDLLKSFSAIKTFHSPNDLAGIYPMFERAIGAAGTSAYERVFLGIPSLNLVTEDNQVRLAEGLESMGLATTLDIRKGFIEDEFTTSFQKFDEESSFPNLSERIIDGDGARRIASNISKLVKV